jgi:hypothetical protein
MRTLIAELGPIVKRKLLDFVAGRAVLEVASLDWIQQVIVELAKAMALWVTDAWQQGLLRLADLLLDCPRCGARRKRKWRGSHPLHVEVLGFGVELPKLYLECEHCGGAGSVSVIKVLTGLASGEASAELKLAVAHFASQHSYGKARRDLEVHYGQSLERTKLRRLALEVEKEAMSFAEAERVAQLHRLAAEARTSGVALILLEADGGKVRSGKLAPCEPEDPGYGKTTPKRALPVRKRLVSWREVITMDARLPGETEASALDVLVPVGAPPGERGRRMHALAGRKGLGDNTRVVGLGDMGSELAASFDETFFAYVGSFWNADWKHTCDYVQAAHKLLKKNFDGAGWAADIKSAIWRRDRTRCDELLEDARKNRVKALPRDLEKCPVAALKTYLSNNWKHMRFAELKTLELPFVSARAEAQVRDRTKDRYCVAGAWTLENIEPKATLRAIIADGRWRSFRAHVLNRHRTSFEKGLFERLGQAVKQGRLSESQVAQLGVELPAAAVEQIAA